MNERRLDRLVAWVGGEVHRRAWFDLSEAEREGCRQTAGELLAELDEIGGVLASNERVDHLARWIGERVLGRSWSELSGEERFFCGGMARHVLSELDSVW